MKPRLLHKEIIAMLRHSEDYIKNRQEGNTLTLLMFWVLTTNAIL